MASAGLPSSSGSSALPRRHTLDNPSGTPFSHRPSNTTVQPIRDAWWSGPNRGLPLRSYTDSLVESEWDDAIRRRHSTDESVASEVERALRYQKRAHSRRNSELSTIGASPTTDSTPSNGVSQTEGLFSTPATHNPRSPTHPRFLEHKAPAPLSPIELHHIQFPREPRIQYPVPPTQWDEEDEEDTTRLRRFSSPQVWLDLVETFKRDHMSIPVKPKPKPKAPPSPSKIRSLIPHLGSSSPPNTGLVDNTVPSRAATGAQPRNSTFPRSITKRMTSFF